MGYMYSSNINSEGCVDIECKVVSINRMFNISISLLSIWCLWLIKVKHWIFLRFEEISFHGVCISVVMQSAPYKFEVMA